MADLPGVEFADCYARRTIAELDGISANVVALEDLRRTIAAGKLRDLNDLQNLP